MEITQTVVEQYESVRCRGEVNMMARTSVKRIARARGYTELVRFIDSGDYTKLLTNYEELREKHLNNQPTTFGGN